MPYEKWGEPEELVWIEAPPDDEELCRCECMRYLHADGRGECIGCTRCSKFRPKN